MTVNFEEEKLLKCFCLVTVSGVFLFACSVSFMTVTSQN